MVLRVGIIGSCVSRLAFRSDFIPENKPFFDVVQYQFHTSLISIFSKPVKYDYSKFKGNDDEYAKEHLVSELEKDGLNNLVASNPDILIIDFYPDVHFGIAYIQDSTITNKCWRYKKIEAFNELAVSSTLEPTISFEEYFKIWKKSLANFMEFMKTYLPNTKVIITGARFAKLQNLDGEICALESKFDLSLRNKVWEKFDSYAIDTYSLDYLDLRYGYIATKEHTHGLDPLHFEKKYYEDFIVKLFNNVFKKKIKHVDDLACFSSSQLISELSSTKKAKEVPSWNLLNAINIWNHNKNTLFNISDEEISINVNGEVKPVYNQLHSLPIEIGGRNNSYFKYKLSFDVFIRNLEKLEDDAIFLVRAHKSKFTLWHKDAISSEMLRAEELGLEGGKWEHVELIILSRDRFLRMGPYLAQNGNVRWKNIVFECLSRE